MKKFKMKHLFFDTETEFDEETAPDWLSSKNTIKGSTMDNRWFWNEHILTLNVGDHIDTDFQQITRIE